MTQSGDRRGRSPGRSPGGGLEGPPTGLTIAVAVLLAVPLAALMWVSSYNKAEPRLAGVPFFYWYQFLWVFIAAACTTVAYRLVMGYERRRRALRGPDARGDRARTGGRR